MTSALDHADQTISMASVFGKTYRESHQTDITARSSPLDQHISCYSKVIRGQSSYTDFVNESVILPVLNPQQIQDFVNILPTCENEKGYDYYTDHFLSLLIQRSHHNGHTTFNLNVRAIKLLEHLCAGIHEIENLNIIIFGTVGTSFAENAKGGTYFLEEAKNNCAKNSNETMFYVRTAGKNFGNTSKHSTFYCAKVGNYAFQETVGGQYYLNSVGNHCARYSQGGTLYIKEGGAWIASRAKDVEIYAQQLASGWGYESSGCVFHSPQSMFDIHGGKIPKTTTLLSAEDWQQKWLKAEQAFQTLDDVLERGVP